MKCRRQPAFLEGKATPITEIWEVRVPAKLWRAIQTAAKNRRTTFSTITRFCAFELAERSTARLGKVAQSLRAEDRREYADGALHRHMVCLYGEDSMLLRLAALRLGISVSAFIRLALRFYLRYFAMEIHSRRYPSDATLFWKAIKRWISIPLTGINQLSLPMKREFVFVSFPPGLRWGWPSSDAT